MVEDMATKNSHTTHEINTVLGCASQNSTLKEHKHERSKHNILHAQLGDRIKNSITKSINLSTNSN